jgi:hypothetical protein
LDSQKLGSMDKKTKEMSDALHLALKSLVNSPETLGDFKCPLGIAITELKRSQMRAEAELQTLKTNSLRLENQVEILGKEKEEMIQQHESDKDKLSKIDTLVRDSSFSIDEIATKLSQFESNMRQGNYSEFVNRTALAIKSSIDASSKYKPICAAGAAKLSIELLDKVNPIFEAARLRAKSSAEEVRLQYQNTLDFITNNNECDPRIPMRFLKLASGFMDMAKQAIVEGQEAQASAYFSSAKELMNSIRSLYDSPELSRLLQIFRRR